MIVLLPGMDGSGRLFKPFLSVLGVKYYQVIALPETGNQDYDSLFKSIYDQLPNDEFILLAESFSGPLAAKLIAKNIPNLKGVIFIASFLSTPSKIILRVAQILPLKWLLSLSIANPAIRYLMLGNRISQVDLENFKSTVASVPNKTLKLRLFAMQNLKTPNISSDLPVTYISATKDFFVRPSKLIEFSHSFTNLTQNTINGPHFILQSNPKACALIIRKIIDNFNLEK